jgi:hypothetical protein
VYPTGTTIPEPQDSPTLVLTHFTHVTCKAIFVPADSLGRWLSGRRESHEECNEYRYGRVLSSQVLDRTATPIGIPYARISAPTATSVARDWVTLSFVAQVGQVMPVGRYRKLPRFVLLARQSGASKTSQSQFGQRGASNNGI